MVGVHLEENQQGAVDSCSKSCAVSRVHVVALSEPSAACLVAVGTGSRRKYLDSPHSHASGLAFLLCKLGFSSL